MLFIDRKSNFVGWIGKYSFYFETGSETVSDYYALIVVDRSGWDWGKFTAAAGAILPAAFERRI